MDKPKEGYIITNSKACTITAHSCIQQELDYDYASLQESSYSGNDPTESKGRRI